MVKIILRIARCSCASDPPLSLTVTSAADVKATYFDDRFTPECGHHLGCASTEGVRI